MIDPAARARLEWWKQSLLDVCDPAEPRIALAADPRSLATALEAGGGLSLIGEPSGTDTTEPNVITEIARQASRGETGAGGAVHARVAATALDDRLRWLERAGRRAAERGEHAVWVGLGELSWIDRAGTAHHAPLVLWPVELERAPGGTPRLVSAVVSGWCEPQLDAALADTLARELDVVLPDVEAGGGAAAVAAVLEAVGGLVLTRTGWRVEPSAVLGAFAVERSAIARDLAAAGDGVLANQVVHSLALGAAAPLFAQPTPEAAQAVTTRVGFTVPGTGASEWATDLLAPLDADARQLQVVAAAGHGASFVLSAPPGTGVTQTIANTIVHCVGKGKTVLLVSDRTAVLQSVHERLAQIGLPDLCLPVIDRAHTVAHLDRVLTRAFRPGGAPRLLDGARLAELRQALDGHASSLHRSGAFGRSLHAVIGRLVELRTTPCAALAEPDAVGLDGATFERRLAAVQALADAAARVEPVASHPWRASTLARDVFDAPGDTSGRDRALAAIDGAAAAGIELAASVREVGALVPGLVATTRDQLQALGALAALSAASPRPGAELLTPLASRAPRAASDALDEQLALLRARGGGPALDVPRDPLAFLMLAKRHRALVDEVRDVFTDTVDELDVHAAWTQLRKWNTRMAPVRYVALRGVRAEVAAAAIPMQLETDSSMIEGLEAAIAERACRAALSAAAEPARRWFGELGGDPLALDLAAIEKAVQWGVDLRRAFDSVEVVGARSSGVAIDPEDPSTHPSNDPVRQAAWRSLVAQVAAPSVDDARDGEDGSDASFAAFARLSEATSRWLAALDDLVRATGIELRASSDDRNAGDHLALLAERTGALRHAIDELADWVTFHDARNTARATDIGPAVPAIERGDLPAADLAPAWERATLLAWAEAELSVSQVAAHGAAHHAHVAAFADLDRAALALVRSRALVKFAERVPTVERGKLDPETPIGRLVGALRAPTPLRELLAIEPDLVHRIAPCLAVTPATAARHLDPSLRFDVVVVDHAGHLPTAEAIGALARCRATIVVGDPQLARGADTLIVDARAARLPELSLDRHYRSRHHELIAFANERYYDDRLQVVPAAQTSPDLGPSWRRAEPTAETIATEVVARLRDPAQRGRSLAVIAMSPDAVDRIQAAIDRAIDGDPDLVGGAEPVIVCDADDAAAIVRDVVIVAADPATIGEPRRLALAITRAREQLVVVAPEMSPDTELGTLLAWIAARTEARASEPADQVPASPITEALARALVDRGWTVHHQVGAGAYRVDLAVVDPNDPGHYVLAIEHDGPIYAAAPAARDRDRLRAEQLVQLGWRVHRIWTLDWWLDAEREVQRAHGAIVTAVAASRRGRTLPAAHPQAAAGSAPVGSLWSKPRRRKVATPAPAPRADTPSVGNPVVLATPIESIDSSTLPNFAAGSAPVKIGRNAIAIGPYVAAAIPSGSPSPRRPVRTAAPRRARQGRRAGPRRRGADARVAPRAPGRGVLRHRPGHPAGHRADPADPARTLQADRRGRRGVASRSGSRGGAGRPRRGWEPDRQARRRRDSAAGARVRRAHRGRALRCDLDYRSRARRRTPDRLRADHAADQRPGRAGRPARAAPRVDRDRRRLRVASRSITAAKRHRVGPASRVELADARERRADREILRRAIAGQGVELDGHRDQVADVDAQREPEAVTVGDRDVTTERGLRVRGPAVVVDRGHVDAGDGQRRARHAELGLADQRDPTDQRGVEPDSGPEQVLVERGLEIVEDLPRSHAVDPARVQPDIEIAVAHGRRGQAAAERGTKSSERVLGHDRRAGVAEPANVRAHVERIHGAVAVVVGGLRVARGVGERGGGERAERA